VVCGWLWFIGDEMRLQTGRWTWWVVCGWLWFISDEMRLQTGRYIESLQVLKVAITGTA